MEEKFAEVVTPLCDPLLPLYTKTAVLRVHLGIPVYNSLDCLRVILCLLVAGHLLSLCCSSSDASQIAINLLLIRLKRFSRSNREAALLCLQQGPNKGSNWHIKSCCSSSYFPGIIAFFCLIIITLLPLLRFVETVGETSDMVNHPKGLMLAATVEPAGSCRRRKTLSRGYCVFILGVREVERT